VLNAFPDESELPPGDGNQGFRGGEEGSMSWRSVS